ncbi:hypothetical protein [Streptacidiphilus anmyonensis]|nr:hypothetical protein [Streptacidiphilus anmyonensis]
MATPLLITTAPDGTRTVHVPDGARRQRRALVLAQHARGRARRLAAGLTP